MYDNEDLIKLESEMSKRVNGRKIKPHEIKTMFHLTNLIHEHVGLDNCIYDNWFYSFYIEKLDKELDLIKFGKNGVVVNVELKSRMTSPLDLEEQLIQNRTYLRMLGEKIYSFTFVEDVGNGTSKLYQYDQGLKESTIEQLISAITEIEHPVETNIEDYFVPSKYLVSPLNTPCSFVEHKYILTRHQKDIKNKIIDGLKSRTKLWGITGDAGTGKTLLLYDVARELANVYKVCIIHSGYLCSGHSELNDKLENIKIESAKFVNLSLLKQFDFLCVDEAHRLRKGELSLITLYARFNNCKGIIFSYDEKQMLSKRELESDNPKRLKGLKGFNEMKLSKNIRTNQDVFSFIRSMFNLKDISLKQMNYDNIDIHTASNEYEVSKIIKIYESKQYKMISLTGSFHVASSLDAFKMYENSHRVLGQEFDSVIVVIDQNFVYDKNGMLTAIEHPNPDYLLIPLLYENVTRARNKLCIIVMNNNEVYGKLMNVKMNIRN